MTNKIPPALNDFIKNAAPAKTPSPLEQLSGRYKENAEEVSRLGGLGPMPSSNREDNDYIVELRIREWMMRVEKEAREAAEAKRLRELHARLNNPHEKKPPGGPHNKGPGNKISPP